MHRSGVHHVPRAMVRALSVVFERTAGPNSPSRRPIGRSVRASEIEIFFFWRKLLEASRGSETAFRRWPSGARQALLAAIGHTCEFPCGALDRPSVHPRGSEEIAIEIQSVEMWGGPTT